MPIPLPKLEQAHALLEAREYVKAKQAYQRLYTLEPGNAAVLMGLAKACSALNDLPQARFFSQRLAAIGFADEQDKLLVGRLLIEVGDAEPAIAYLDRALEAHPGSIALTRMLLQLLYVTRRTGRAKQLSESLLVSDPANAPAWHGTLGAVLRSEGRVREAMDHHRLEVAGAPASAEARMQLAITSMYDDRCTPQEVSQAHRDFAQAMGWDACPPIAARARQGPLRVGVLSPDFVTHSVAYFALPLVEGLVRQGAHVTCYSTGNKTDETTDAFRAAASVFRDVWTLSAGELVDRIRADGIDVLVDLAGLSMGGRLDALSQRCARVQVSYCGYPCTTGCAMHDFRIVDSTTDLAGAAGLCTEQLLRLDPCFLCYRPRVDAPPPKPASSASAADSVTFGSFNILTKVNDGVIDVWARILRSVPGSVLALKSNMLTQEGVREHFVGAFGARGVPADRLKFLAWTDTPAAHLALYHGIDIALDPFPYNGTTTTCEALSMGVPVVTLEGKGHAGRVGTSLLGACGLPELVAQDADAYVALAASLTADRARREALHARIPGAFAASPLRDEVGFAARMHALLESVAIRA
ncbi:MAG TPA: tetratricopeptide repeat protein [Phycisphaerales bacterium]|nr:tetratricopeptide repeat protein [Phycisphaerales bacterium]